MNIVRILAMVVCCAALATGCSTPGGGAATDETLTDSQIASDVMTRMNDDSVMRRAKPINVEVKDGVVTLRGILRDDAVRARAVGVARGTPGVKDVIDLIEDR